VIAQKAAFGVSFLSLHMVRHQDEYRYALNMFVEHWTLECPAAFQRFQRAYLRPPKNLWARVNSIPGIPATNNAHEAFNGSIKKFVTSPAKTVWGLDDAHGHFYSKRVETWAIPRPHS